MLRKSTLREIRTSLARYLAIFAIVALGVGFFSGLRDCKPSMVRTATEYLEKYNMYDYMIISSYGADDDSVSLARSEENVTDAEGSVQMDVLATAAGADEVALKAISLPENINRLRVVSGRLPQKDDECVIDDYHIDSEGYKTGDTIVLTDSNDEDTLEKFRHHEYRIVGTVNTPIYLDYQRGSTDIGNGSLETFFFIKRSEFDTDYYTQLYLTLDGDEKPFTDEKADSLEAAEDGMKDLAKRITAGRRQSAMDEAQEELDEKKQEYEDNLSKYEKEKADAEKKLRDAEEELDDGQAQIDDMTEEIETAKAGLETTISDLEEKISAAETGISTINSKIKEAESGLSKAQAGKKQLTEARAGLEAQKSELESQETALQTQIENLQAQAEADPESAEEINAQIAALNEQLTQLQTQAGAVDAGLGEIDAKIAAADETIGGINSGIAQLRAELNKAQAGKTAAENGLAQARGGVAQADAGLEELSSRQDELDEGRAEFRREKEKAEKELSDAKKKLDDAKDKLDEAQQKIDDMETGNSYAISCAENQGYSSFDSNSSIVSNIAKIFPVFFFLIAALVCMTTMTRMVDEQRTQIGILKALGYSNAQIVAKYMFYSGSAAFLGALTGFFVGCKIFPAVIWDAYTMMYDFSENVAYVLDIKLGLISLAAALLCSMGSTWVSIAQDFQVAPADLIRPKTPPAGKRILLERIKPLWSRISFLYKVSLRNIFRDKKRFFMMVIGISGCTALLIAGMGIDTTIARVADHQFSEISLYDFRVIFSKNMNAGRQQDFIDHMSDTETGADDIFFLHQGEVTILTDTGNYDVTCTASEPEGFDRYIDLHDGSEPLEYPGEGEVVIVRKISHDYGVKTGDRIRVRDGYKEAEFLVSGVCDNYVYDSIYVSRDTYRKAFGRDADIKSALVRLDAPEGAHADDETIRSAAAQAAGYENTAAVSVSIDVKDSVAKMMESLNLVVYVVILSAALLAFIVLYNLTNINITERIREIATIKVLGFNQLEVAQYVFRENIFLTAFAVLVGIPVGKWLLGFVIDNIVVKMIYFEPRLANKDIAIAVALTFLFSALVSLAMRRRLNNVSMTESLKSVE